MGDFLQNVFDVRTWAAVPFHFWSLVFFTLGSIVGSFLNVCIYRMPLEQSVISPPSHCPKCRYSIPFYLNIPLVAWLYLGGKCAKCREPISIRYFLVELLTGILFMITWIFYGSISHWLALSLCLFVAALIVASFIDLEHLIIPDEITIGGMVVGFILSFLVPELQMTTDRTVAIGRSLWGMGLGAGLLYAVVRAGKLFFGKQKVKMDPNSRLIFSETALHLPGEVVPYEDIFYRNSDVIIFEGKHIEMADRCYLAEKIKVGLAELKIGSDTYKSAEITYLEATTDKLILPREAMGLGDVKFIGAIGAFLGAPVVLFTIMSSSIIGSVYGLTLQAIKGREGSVQIYYGPFLALGSLIWIYGGTGLQTWWMRNLETLQLLAKQIFTRS